MDNFTTKVQALADLITEQTLIQLNRQYPGHDTDGFWNEDAQTHIRPGLKYTKIDVGSSGKYMIDNATGEIFGIKAYGVIHRGYRFGTLDTINDYYWGDYRAVKRGTTNRIVLTRQAV